MKTMLAALRLGRATRALTAALTGALLVTSIATAQESPPPGASAAPSAAQPEVTGSAPRPRRWAVAAMPDRRAGWMLNDVIAGGPGFIAVGGGSRGRARSGPEAIIWVSDRGRAWQAVPLFGAAAEGTIRAITASEDGFVAVGDAGEGAAVWTSADGIGWQRIPHDASFDGAVMFDVADGPAGLVAVGCEGSIDCATSRAWRSPDGSTWEALSTAPPFTARAIEATTDGYRVAGAQSPAATPMIANSADGQAWQSVEGLPPGPAGLAALGVFGDALAGGSSAESGAVRAILLRSSDGTAWQSVAHRSFGAADIADLASDSAGVMLVGSREQGSAERQRSRPLALWSADLRRFRATPFPGQSTRAGGEVNAVAFSPDGSLLVAVGATRRPVPAAWFSRMAVPRAAAERSAQPDVAETPDATSTEAPSS